MGTIEMDARLKRGMEWTLSAPAPPPDMLQISLLLRKLSISTSHSQAQVEEPIPRIYQPQ